MMIKIQIKLMMIKINFSRKQSLCLIRVSPFLVKTVQNRSTSIMSQISIFNRSILPFSLACLTCFFIILTNVFLCPRNSQAQP